jgi:hypothetical protein
MPDTPLEKRRACTESKEKERMNALEGLQRIRERLLDNDARAETIKLVDSVIRAASQPGADRAQARSLSELVRRLMRTPAAHANVGIYDDFAVLEEQLDEAGARAAAERAAEETRPMPKPKKYYKALKEKDERQRGDA